MKCHLERKKVNWNNRNKVEKRQILCKGIKSWNKPGKGRVMEEGEEWVKVGHLIYADNTYLHTT